MPDNNKTPAKSSPSTGEVLPRKAGGEFIAYLERRAVEDGGNLAVDIAARQIDAMMSAATEEEMLGVFQREAIGGRDLEDVEMIVHSFTVHTAYSFNAPLGHFIMIYAQRLDNGEELIFDTSSPLIIGLLRWYEAKEMLPKELVIRGAHTPAGGEGGRRLWMEPVPKRAVKAETAAS